MIDPESVKIAEQRLERHRRQILEWQRKANMTTEGTLARKHTSELMEAIAPVIRNYVQRSIDKATAPLKVRIAKLEIAQRASKRAKSAKALKPHKPVKCMF